MTESVSVEAGKAEAPVTQIRSWVTGEVLLSFPVRSLVGANLSNADLRWANLSNADLSNADLRWANLSKANLTEANLTEANLTEADLTEADLRGANLSREQLEFASLGLIKEDFYRVLNVAPSEVSGLRLALTEGRIDGTQYKGECACLVGTIANTRHCSHSSIPGIYPDASRASERWFLAIRPGDVPETSPVAAVTVKWIDEWLLLHPSPVVEGVTE